MEGQGGNRIERMEASEVITMVSMGCWMACSMVYLTKLTGIDDKYLVLCGYSFVYGLWYFVHTTLMMDDANPDGEASRTRKRLRGEMLLLVASFWFVDYPFVCLYHVLIVLQEGYLLICLFRFYKICYGLFLGLLAGVVFSSYKGFGTQDPSMYNYIVFLSVVLIFLCGLHWWRRSYTSVNHLNSPDAPDAPDADAAVPQAHDDQIHQSLLV